MGIRGNGWRNFKSTAKHPSLQPPVRGHAVKAFKDKDEGSQHPQLLDGGKKKVPPPPSRGSASVWTIDKTCPLGFCP